MAEANDQFPNVSVQELKGLNERSRFSNPDVTEFDFLLNATPGQLGSLQKMLGCKRNSNFSLPTASPILGICQTFDSSHNVIVQTRDGVYVITEEDLFGIATTPPDLVPYVPPVFGAITAASVANPTQLTTGVPHGLTTGDYVVLGGFTDGTFSVAINAKFQVTVVDPTHFTVPSNCTVAPTDYSGTIFTLSVAPEFDGDDELYPSALLDYEMDSGSFGTISADSPVQFSSSIMRIAYQLNPDGSNASFIDTTSHKLSPGRYRIRAWLRMSTTTIAANIVFGISVTVGTISGLTSAVESVVNSNGDNITAYLAAEATVAFPFYINAFWSADRSISNVYLSGKQMTGFVVGKGVRIEIIKLS